MIQPIRPAYAWGYMRTWRSVAVPEALDSQQSALKRRRQLQLQYEGLRCGPAGYAARPAYPPRPRPPS